jgi:hypothetical protein
MGCGCRSTRASPFRNCGERERSKQPSQRFFFWFILLRGLRVLSDSALCCADPPLSSTLLLLFFLGLFGLVPCGCVLLFLFLGETSAWLVRLIRAVGLASASASFRSALLRARFLFSSGASRICGRLVLCRFQGFPIFLDKGADASATRHFFQLFDSSCSSHELDAATSRLNVA